MATNFTKKVGYGLSEPLPIIGLEPIVTKRDPTTADKAPIGAEWINTATNNAFFLTSIEDNIATWVPITNVGTSPEFVADSGIAIPVAGVLRVTGSGISETSGSGNTLVINTPVTNYVTSAGTATPSSNTLNIIGGAGVATTGSGSTVTISLSGSEPTFFGDFGSATPISNDLKVITGYAGGVLDGSGTCQISATGNQLVFIATDPTGNTIYGSGSAPNTGSPGGNSNSGFGDVCMQGAGPFTGNSNTGMGASCLEEITSGSNNTSTGANSGELLTTGGNNCFYGFRSGATLSTGTNNVFMGYESGGAVISTITGSYNVEIGFEAGVNYTSTESSNISLNASSTTVVGESHVLRIGNGTGSGNQQLNSAFISGINGVNVGSVASVVSISGDHLGSATLTAGSGITITPTANTITIAASGGGGITSITGDSGGSQSGPAITLTMGAANANGTATFVGATNTITLTPSDSGNNTAWGKGAMASGVISGTGNSCYGFNTGKNISSGTVNTLLGESAGTAITTSSGNTAIGSNALEALTTGTGNNISIGSNSGLHLTTGDQNTLVGIATGGAYTSTESNNICIGYNVQGTIGQSNVLNIGAGTGTGAGQLNSTFVSGIQGITVTGTAVLVSASDQLGIAVSSKRFKNDIQTMNTESDALYKLRPVTFVINRDSAPGLADATTDRQCGLIAEEVAHVLPQYVSKDENGDPLSVHYGDLTALLIKEVQRLSARIAALEGR